MNQMKCSYSMSSLEYPPQKYLRTPEGAKKPVSNINRLTNSLNSKKPRRTFEKKMWRRSWGSGTDEQSQDEVWKAYETCAQGLNGDGGDLRNFLEEYSSVCEWLNSVQIQRGQFADVEKLSELGNELLKKQPWRVKINETAKSLLKNYPKLKEEFQWRVKHLNSQWDALEKILLCQSANNFSDAILKHNENQLSGVDWLRGWLKEMESQLRPLQFRTEWTAELLQPELVHHKSLQSGIEENSSKVHEALRELKEPGKRSRLETRWLQLRLRVLEWVQHLSGIEERIKHRKKNSPPDKSYYEGNYRWGDSDGENNEPRSKYPRLGDRNGDFELVNRKLSPAAVVVSSVASAPKQSTSEDVKKGQVDVDVDKKDLPLSGDCLGGFESAEVSSRLPAEDRKEEGGRKDFVGVVVGFEIRISSGDKFSALKRGFGQLVDFNRKATADEGGRAMGQSHDSENVFNQSGSPVPNSVVEYIFDENNHHSGSGTGMKRKLSSSSYSPSQSQLLLVQEEDQQVVPRNISTYYFKHSDTEQTELNRANATTTTSSTNHKNSNKNRNKNRNKAPLHSSLLNDCKMNTSLESSNRRNGNNNNAIGRSSWGQNCQKSAKTLAFSQQFAVGINSIGGSSSTLSSKFNDDEISFESELEEFSVDFLTPDVAVCSKEDEVMMDLEEEEELENELPTNFIAKVPTIVSQTSANSCRKVPTRGKFPHSRSPFVVDEIGELVQQAEELVKLSTRSRGGDVVDFPIESTEEDEMNGEDELILHKHPHRSSNRNRNISNVNSASLLFANAVNAPCKKSNSRKFSSGSCACDKSGSGGGFNSGTCCISVGNYRVSKNSWASAVGVGGFNASMNASCNGAGNRKISSGSGGGVAIFGGESESLAVGNVSQQQNEDLRVLQHGQQKGSKKSSRVRQWVRAHNSGQSQEGLQSQKNTSSCDASAESASESEEGSAVGSSPSSSSEHPPSSEDPTTISVSTLLQQTQAALAECGTFSRSIHRSSSKVMGLSSRSSSNNNIDPLTLGVGGLGLSSSFSRARSGQSSVFGRSCSNFSVGAAGVGAPSSSIAGGGVILRQKKRSIFGKQRPKSFTETLVGSGSASHTAGSSQWLDGGCFVSDTALNLLGSRQRIVGGGGWSSSGSGSAAEGSGAGGSSPGNYNSDFRKKASNHRGTRKRVTRSKRKSVDDILGSRSGNCGTLQDGRVTSNVCDDEIDHRLLSSGDKSNLISSGGADKENAGGEGESEKRSEPKPQFQILGPVGGQHQPSVGRLNSDNNSSMNTDGLNDQDWDSYQEKYMSEPYSEEPYDPDRTLKLLAFGEDYGQYLERPDSESSSILSGFAPKLSKRRPLVVTNRTEMPESDSDIDELNHLLSQSTAQLRFVDAVFRKQLAASADNDVAAPTEYAEMEATCDENIGSLKMVLLNVEKREEELPFPVDVKSIEGVLEKWQLLKERIRQAARLHQIREEMDDLKSDFSSVQSHFEDVDPYDSEDLVTLQDKIGYIQEMLGELSQRKHKLQLLNEASLGTQLFLKDTSAGDVIKDQLQELYALYEENFQLGSYLLDKMRFLQDAWEKFEAEKSEFERSISVGNLRSKLRKEFSSAASTDSGHGTDASHDSSISDSDMDFNERRQKLAALKKRAFEIKAFLPPGSPVMDVIEQRVIEAEKGLHDLQQSVETDQPFSLKIIYPKKKSPVLTRKSHSKHKSGGTSSSQSKSSSLPVGKPGRKWKVVRRMVLFNFALMGLFLAAAYILHPKCCEFSNTFCFSLVPHLTHETLPPI